MEINRENLAWAGGFFEGEGCLASQRDKRYPTSCSFVAVLKNADEDVMRRFTKIIGVGKIFGPYKVRSPYHKPLFEWRVTSFEKVQYVVAVLWPWLGQRRRAKAKELLAQARSRKFDVSQRLNFQLTEAFTLGTKTQAQIARDLDISAPLVNYHFKRWAK